MEPVEKEIKLETVSSRFEKDVNLSSCESPNTDNLLDISPTKILGKEQAKRRLLAFKSNYLGGSPSPKKDVKRKEASEVERKPNENEREEKKVKKSKKLLNHNDKAKAVVEEIEEIKKRENAYIETMEHKKGSKSRRDDDKKRHKKDRKRSNSNHKSKKKSSSRHKTSTNWKESKESGDKSQQNSLSDFRKQLLFEDVPLPLSLVTFETVNGYHRKVPTEYLRFTKQLPSISYSATQRVPSDCYSRKNVLQYIPKRFRKHLLKIVEGESSFKEPASSVKIKSRPWYLKNFTDSSNSNGADCQVLEHTLSLSLLQAYSDGEEVETEQKEITKTRSKSHERSRKVEKEKPKERKADVVKQRSPSREYRSEESRQAKKDTSKQRSNSRENREESRKTKKEVAKHRSNSREHRESEKSKKEVTKPRSKSREHCNDESRKSKEQKPKEDKSVEKEIIREVKAEETKHVEKDNIPDKIQVECKETETKLNEEKTKLNEEKTKLNEEEIKLNEEETKLNEEETKLNEEETKPNEEKEEVEKKDEIECEKIKSELKDDKPEVESSTKKEKSKTKKSKRDKPISKVKCVAAIEFGTPDTDEYYSKWESDDDHDCNTKSTVDSTTQMLWERDDCLQNISMEEPLGSKSHRESPVRSVRTHNRHKGDKSRDVSLDGNLSPISPVLPTDDYFPHEEYSSFGSQNNDRRKSRHSMDKMVPQQSTPIPALLEIPLNIRNTYNNRYARIDWEEDRFDRNAYNTSKTNSFSLFTEDSWERDDYLTIKTEELRLAEARRTLAEERRQLEIEKRQWGERERQRYLEIEKQKFDDLRIQNQYDFSEEERSRHRNLLNYREFDVSSEDLRTRRKYSSERSRERSQEKLRFNSDNQTTDKPPERVKVRASWNKSRWNSSDAEDDVRPQPYIAKIESRSSKEKDKWESSEDEAALREKGRFVKKQKKERKKSRFSKEIPSTKVQVEATEPLSLTDNLDVSQKSLKAQKPEVLENEYEKFMQVLETEIKIIPPKIELKNKDKKRESKKRKRKRDTSSSSSSSSSSCSTTSGWTSSNSSSSSSSSGYSLSNSKKKKKKKTSRRKVKRKTKKINKESRAEEFPELSKPKKSANLNISNLSLPQLMEDSKTPLPVPSPNIKETLSNLQTIITNFEAVNSPVALPSSPLVSKENSVDSLKTCATLGEVLDSKASIELPEIKVEPTEKKVKLICSENNLIPVQFLTNTVRKEPPKIKVLPKPVEIKIENKTDDLPEAEILKPTNDNQVIEPTKKDEVVAEKKEVDCKVEIEADKTVSKSISPRRRESISPRRDRRMSRSPRRYNSKRYKDVSPRRRERSRSLSPRRRYSRSPRRSYTNSKRFENSPRKYSISPRRKDYSSRSPRRRSISRDSSPRRRSSLDRSTNKERKKESIQETLARIAGVDKYNKLLKQSPISSPLHGFKRSVADSTISDDQLLQCNSEEYTQSPCLKVNFTKSISSPKRVSLDERINQVLGIAEEPKPITTTYSQPSNEYDSRYYNECNQYYENYHLEYAAKDCQPKQRDSSNLKVLQIGNNLQVVPIDDTSEKPSPPVQQNKITNSTQKIVQVGNMLQIVPIPTLPEEKSSPVSLPAKAASNAAKPAPLAALLISPNSLGVSPLNAEVLIKQKAERRAEKLKRKQEREKKRKEKERKRKEREKRKQLKVKLQTEAMIKQALSEDILNDEIENESQTHTRWPPLPQVVFSGLQKPPGKGILNRINKEEGASVEVAERKFKYVTFSDGIMPGEGTSPSGGEELSSPPPNKLPKEKRFKKTKPPKPVKVLKKKKVKVKVIRQQLLEEDDEDEDDLPPPPPPPGSPPPHIFPVRIKQHINNIHPKTISTITNPPPNYQPIYRPPPQPTPIIMSHHGHHHHMMPNYGPPPHHHGHHHHVPVCPPPSCPPPHHVAVCPPYHPPPVVVIPPVVSVCEPPRRSLLGRVVHHAVHGGHHHHHHHHHRRHC